MPSTNSAVEGVAVMVMVMYMFESGVFSPYSLLAEHHWDLQPVVTLPRKGKGRKGGCKDKLCVFPREKSQKEPSLPLQESQKHFPERNSYVIIIVSNHFNNFSSFYSIYYIHIFIQRFIYTWISFNRIAVESITLTKRYNVFDVIFFSADVCVSYFLPFLQSVKGWTHLQLQSIFIFLTLFSLQSVHIHLQSRPASTVN